METKTISVNPDFFSNTKRKKTKKKKLKHSLRTNFNKLQKNFLKEKMIDKIKDFKKKNKFKNNQENSTGFNDEYSQAIDFMEDVVKKRKTKKNKKKNKERIKQIQQQDMQQNFNQEIKPNINHQIVQHQNFNKFNKEIIKNKEIIPNQTPNNIINIQTEISNDLNKIKIKNNLIKPDPPYGILKKGKKQLYSKYRKSLSNNTLAFTNSNSFGKELDINKEIINIKNNNFLSENIPNRKQKLENLKNKFLKNNNLDDKKERFKIKNKKIIRKFLLGKNNTTKKVGILIKNKKTRKLINKDCRKLEKNKIKIIKKFLVDKALIKVGTSAPESILREMYMNCYLSGELQNSGGKNAEEILMHNWNN